MTLLPGEKEVDRWIDTPEWELAEYLHGRLCKRGHQMDECWGLNMPYDLAQPRLSEIQRHYLALAMALSEAFERVEIDLILELLSVNWHPEKFPEWPPSKV